MSIYLRAFLSGSISWLRAMTAGAAAAWAAYLRRLDLSRTRRTFIGNDWLLWILTALVLLELLAD